jgi:diadenosine tetraphosphate (Ap4A) HIT family hydrolase
MSSTEECLFCAPDDPTKNRIIVQNDLAYARWDNYPERPGHSQVVPFRHVHSFFDLNGEEAAALVALSREVRQVLDDQYRPEGYNLFSNIGYAAGQRIMHVHMHIIPRITGDQPVVLGHRDRGE